jgi:hypothetical protein
MDGNMAETSVPYPATCSSSEVLETLQAEQEVQVPVQQEVVPERVEPQAVVQQVPAQVPS